MFAYIAPFLVVSAIVLGIGSVYYAVESMLRSRRPKRINATSLNYINFKDIFSC